MSLRLQWVRSAFEADEVPLTAIDAGWVEPADLGRGACRFWPNFDVLRAFTWL
jgi:hypothetical protein